MKKAGITSAADLARAARLNPSTVRAYLNGNREPGADRYEALAKPLKVSPDWLRKGDNPGSVNKSLHLPQIKALTFAEVHNPVTSRVIPVYGATVLGIGGLFVVGDDFSVEMPAPTSLENVDDAYGVLVSGESMEPRYEAGEVVFVNPRIPVKKGSYVVVQFKPEAPGDPIMGAIRRFLSATASALVLEQLNPRESVEIPLTRIHAMHRITWAGDA